MNRADFKRKVEIERELALLDQAKRDIYEGGQSSDVGDIKYTNANINALYAREEKLRHELNRLNGSRPVMVPVDFGNMYR